MTLKSYYGKNVTVVLEEGEIFSGVVVEYFFPEDNELGEESIILKTKKFGLIEFTASEINEIKFI